MSYPSFPELLSEANGFHLMFYDAWKMLSDEDKEKTNKIISFCIDTKVVALMQSRRQKIDGRRGDCVIDRGTFIIQRDMSTGMWYYSLFAKGKKDDSCPDWRIPLALIEKVSFGFSNSKGRNYRKGHIRIETKCTLDVHKTLEPMWIDIYHHEVGKTAIEAFTKRIMEDEGQEQEHLVFYKNLRED